MNYYRNLIEQKQIMYADILNRETIVADDVAIVFTDVEAGWFDASVVVNGVEEYMFSFSDINEDIYDFVDWLEKCACRHNAQASVYIDCEFEQMSFTIEKLPKDYHRADCASYGLLWWYNDDAENHCIQYCIVNISQFVSKTYMALLYTTITKRFKILAWWQDRRMRENDLLSSSPFDGYEFLQMNDLSELVSNQLQLLFYNNIRSIRLDELAFEMEKSRIFKPKEEIVDIVFLQRINDKYILRDINGKEYKSVKISDLSGCIINDAIKMRKQLPENISLFCSGFEVSVKQRAPDVNDQTPYSQNIPILIPYGSKNLRLQF